MTEVTQIETPLAEPPPELKSTTTEVIETETETETSKPKPVEPPGEKKPAAPPISQPSFKEESNRAADLTPHQHTALEDLKLLVTPDKLSTGTTEINIWGVPLMKDERSDTILLKFLRAREFKVKDAFMMLENTIRWRKEFNIDSLIDEDLGDEFDKVVFTHGFDKEGHPVCYNVYGEFQNKEFYKTAFGTEERRKKFLRWRIQFLEKSLRKLDYSPGGVCTIFQVSDLKNSASMGWEQFKVTSRQVLTVLQDNYPEFVAKQAFINVPWWYMTFYTIISPFLTQRTKSKFVFASPAKTAETLFKYISPEQVPIQYGGLSVDLCDCNPEFSMDDPAVEINVKPSMKHTVEIRILEACTLVWELRVVGWDVTYSAEFVPNAEDAYTVVIQKPRKMTPTDEPVLSYRFKVVELGKVLLVIDNPTKNKKKFVYRLVVKPL